MENIEKLVVKEANEAGGYGIWIGCQSHAEDMIYFGRKSGRTPKITLPSPLFRSGDIWWMATPKVGT